MATDPFNGTLTNPRYGDSGNGSVILDCILKGVNTTFFAAPYDIVPYGVTIYNNAIAGEYGTIAPYSVSIPSFSILQQQVINSAVAACNFISTQIYTTPSLQTALILFGSILNSSGGTILPSNPMYSRVQSLASNYGVSVTKLVTIASALQLASLDIANAQLSLINAINTPGITSVVQLGSILSTFQKTINTIVNNINLAVPNPIPAPATILIAGINA